MGPGLFFLLALSASSSRAETSVGLDARGVDPMAAVDNSMGLDVRDELGRPVTAQAVLRDVKQAAARRVEQASYASTLPKARVVLPALEWAAGLGVRLVQFAEGRPAALVSASLPSPRPRIALALIASPGVVPSRGPTAARPRPILSRFGCRCPEVLRC